jgi:hypothetical protein
LCLRLREQLGAGKLAKRSLHTHSLRLYAETIYKTMLMPSFKFRMVIGSRCSLQHASIHHITNKMH